MALKIKVRDWNAKPPWAGRAVVVQYDLTTADNKHVAGQPVVFEAIKERRGTLAGYVADGEYASHVRVAFAPGEWSDYPVGDVYPVWHVWPGGSS